MIKEAILHNSHSNFAYRYNKETIVIMIRVKKDDIATINLYYGDCYTFNRYKSGTTQIVMEKNYSDSIFDYYEADVPARGIKLTYFFEIIDHQSHTIYFGNNIFYDIKPDKTNRFFLLPVRDDYFSIPSWHKDAVIYQIFPDRFNRGSEYIHKNRHDADWYTKVNHKTYLGGTLNGIREKIPYFKELGINVIYLTPVFKAKSPHRYDTVDYYEIDPDLGTKEELKELIDELHDNDIRIIFDAVFNHCDPDFFAFQDLVKNGEKSDYKDWFFPHSFPVKVEYTKYPNYHTFGYFPNMPKIDLTNDEASKYFIDVSKYWTKEFNLDGWRLDVADEISINFWQKFRYEMKKINSDILISGEIWHDSGPWLAGDQFDTVMNYFFVRAADEYIAKKTINIEQFHNNLTFALTNYMRQVSFNIWNIIDSHDVSRFLSLADNNKKKLRLAALLQFTYVGIPMVYYGTEVGMDGGKDPDNRMGMYWDEDKQDKNLLQFYTLLIDLRKNNKEFSTGEITILKLDKNENIYAYMRSYRTNEKDGDKISVVYINFSDKEVILPQSIMEATGKKDNLKVFSTRQLDIDNVKVTDKITLSSEEGVVVY